MYFANSVANSSDDIDETVGGDLTEGGTSACSHVHSHITQILVVVRAVSFAVGVAHQTTHSTCKSTRRHGLLMCDEHVAEVALDSMTDNPQRSDSGE
jgi:hypothetical protein